MSKNMVIYHRNNRTLEIQNHIDKDGDLDPNYVMLRNTGLTGNKQRFKWLTECASKGCPICSGIFEPDRSKWIINLEATQPQAEGNPVSPGKQPCEFPWVIVIKIVKVKVK